MADWEYEPHFTYEIERIGPKTLTTYFEDGGGVIVEKNSTVKRRFHQRYREDATTAQTMLAFLTTKQFNTAFTIITFDPESATPDTDTATVRQLPPKPKTSEVAGAPGVIEFDLRLMEV